MHGLAVLARPLLPRGDGAFIEAEGGDDGLGRAAIGEEGNDPDDLLGIGLQVVEGRSLSAGKGFAAGPAFPAIAQAVVAA